MSPLTVCARHHRRGRLMPADPLTPAEDWMRWVQKLRAIANEAPPVPESEDPDDLALPDPWLHGYRDHERERREAHE